MHFRLQCHLQQILHPLNQKLGYKVWTDIDFMESVNLSSEEL